MKIRKIGAGERVKVSLPIQAYAFEASPAEPTADRQDDIDRQFKTGLEYVLDGIAARID